MYRNLREFIGRLEREGELRRVKAPVDPVLEIAEITDRVSKSTGGGRTLLFENTGTRFPVVTNLFGSERRMAMALGAQSLDEIKARLDGLLQEALSPKGSFTEKVRTLPLLVEASKWFPRHASGRGECQQVVFKGDEARLSELPVLKCWPHDGGRFVTLPLVHTVHPETGSRNVGMYRMQIFDDRTTGMHWHIHKTGARHYDAYRRAGISRMPVAVCLGGDPVYTYAATAPMPEGMDEYLLAGFLRRKPVGLVKCLTNELRVPADCDFVIEGYVDTTEPLRTEGPFGDHTGFYSLEDPYPAFHVTAITHRKDAVYPATLVGIPPQEDAHIAAATEKIFLPPIRLALQPEVRDLYMPPAGTAHNLAVVSLDTAYSGQSEKVANALWGAGQMMFNKVLIAVPADVDVRDPKAVMSLLGGVDVKRDLVFGHGILDVLDHATATPGVGGKLLIDLTHGRTGGAMPFVFEFDEAAADLTPYEKLWLGLANINPARDIRIEGNIAVFDCRAKISHGENMPSRWPNVTVMDEATVRLVDSRWEEYGLGAPLTSLSDLNTPFASLSDHGTSPASLPDPGAPLASPSDRYRKLLLSDGAEV